MVEKAIESYDKSIKFLKNLQESQEVLYHYSI